MIAALLYILLTKSLLRLVQDNAVPHIQKTMTLMVAALLYLLLRKNAMVLLLILTKKNALPHIPAVLQDLHMCPNHQRPRIGELKKNLRPSSRK